MPPEYVEHDMANFEGGDCLVERHLRVSGDPKPTIFIREGHRVICELNRTRSIIKQYAFALKAGVLVQLNAEKFEGERPLNLAVDVVLLCSGRDRHCEC